MTRTNKRKTVIAFCLSAVITVLLLTAAYLIIRHVHQRAQIDEALEEAVVENAQASLIELDLSEEDIKVSDEKDAESALSKIKGIFADQDIQKHAKASGVDEVGGSTYYRFDCTCDDLPIFGQGITLAAQEEKASAVLSNYTFTDNVDRSDSLDADMLKAGVDDFLGEWVVENFEEELSCEAASVGKISDGQKGYYPVDQDRLQLAYTIPCSFKTEDGQTYSVDICASAADGTVLDYCNTVDDLTGSGYGSSGKEVKAYNADGTQEVDAVKEGGKYVLEDADLNITIINADGKSHTDSWIQDYSAVTSDNKYFGDTKTERDKHYDRAVRLMKIMQGLASFYKEQFHDEFPAGLAGIYDDGYSFGKNMSSSTMAYDIGLGGLVFVGSNRDYDLLETFGHEFGHLIQKKHTSMPSSKNRSREIKEAMADVLGILYESEATGKKPDWKVDKGFETRDLAKSGSQEDLFHPNDYHKRSTEFSHAAYLMYKGNGGSHIEAISDTDALMELWYRTTLLVTGAPTYQDGRIACEAAAKQMVRAGSLTEDQYNCVQWAFDSIGVTSNKANVIRTVFGGKLKVRALSALGGGATDYTIDIRKADGEKVVSQSVQDTGFAEIKLDPGCYIVTVKDNKGIWASAKGTVAVSAGIVGSVDGKLEIPTTFGTCFLGQVWDGKDSDSGTIGGVKIVLEGRSVTGKDEKQAKTYKAKADEDGGYYINIRPGNYRLTAKKEGYETCVIEEADMYAGRNRKDDSKLDPPTHYIVMQKTDDSDDTGKTDEPEADGKKDSDSGKTPKADTGGQTDRLPDYASVVRDAEAKYGPVALEDTGWCCMTHGVNYLQLADMDSDGSDELIIGYNTAQQGSNMQLEVWTTEKNAVRCAGKAQVYLAGADMFEVVTTTWAGRPAILGGNMNQDPMFYAWTFENGKLTAQPLDFGEAEMLDYIQNDTGAERNSLNIAQPDHLSGQAPIRELFYGICLVREELGLPQQAFPEWPD